MADLAVFSAHLYLPSTEGFIQSEDGDGTLSDGETTPPDGDTFEIGDTFSFPVADGLGGTVLVTANYAGFLTSFDGELVPVLLTDDAFIRGVFGEDVYVVLSARDATDVTAPMFIDFGSDLNTGPFTVCFLPGTGIATPTGTAAVETLSIGDLILTADGRTVPVRWIGRQTVATRFRRRAGERPVRISAGALGNGLPTRDLCVTPDHALLIDGLLVNAGALVGAEGITLMSAEELGDLYTIYHVETADHDIILAEGTPTETFVDYVGRTAFDNHAEFLALYGEDRRIPEQPYPRILSARHLPQALRARFGLVQAA